MKIGIDISQIAYKNTGVANYLINLLTNLLKIDPSNEYTLFFSSFRRKIPGSVFALLKNQAKVKIKTYKFPPILLDFFWNRLHILPIENFIGNVDIFISSDWTEPPVKNAKKITILYDLVVYKHPEETAEKIIDVHKRKLRWTVKESDLIICISNSTKKDAQKIFNIPENRLKVVYPGA